MIALKRINAPRSYNVKRKVKQWVMRSRPGPHNANAVSITLFLRDLTKIAQDAKEVRQLLLSGKVLIDGKARKDMNYPVGFMDAISVNQIKKHYRVVYDNIGRIAGVPINAKEAELKIEMITNKQRMKDKYQITTHDGRNLLVKLTDGKTYSVGDSLLIKVPSQEIIKHLILKNGMNAFIIGGNHVGETAVIKEVGSENKITVSNGKEEYSTVKKYVFVTGEKKEELKLNE